MNPSGRERARLEVQAASVRPVPALHGITPINRKPPPVTRCGVGGQTDGVWDAAVVDASVAGAAGGALLAAVGGDLKAALAWAAVQASAVAHRLDGLRAQLHLAARRSTLAAACQVWGVSTKHHFWGRWSWGDGGGGGGGSRLSPSRNPIPAHRTCLILGHAPSSDAIWQFEGPCWGEQGAEQQPQPHVGREELQLCNQTA